MKYLILLLLTIITSLEGMQGQIYDPVSFEAEIHNVKDSTSYLTITATIEDGWHLYSQNIPQNGPIPTTFKFKKSNKYIIADEVIEPAGIQVEDPVFDMNIKYFEKSAKFSVPIELLSEEAFLLQGSIEYMVCDDKRCLPPTIKKFEAEYGEVNNIKEEQNNFPNTIKSSSVHNSHNLDKNEGNNLANISKEIFIVTIISGFAALLALSLLPIIPITVNFFPQKRKSRIVYMRKTILLGFGFVIIFQLLPILTTTFLGNDVLIMLYKNSWLNFLLFILSLIFALLLMADFQIIFPSHDKTTSKPETDYSGIPWIFYMSLALITISFSSNSLIAEKLLISDLRNNAFAPLIRTIGYFLVIILPLLLFTTFPKWINRLRSSGELHTIRVSFGFLQLAVAVKFLSNADQALQMHILEREVFLAMWIAIFGLLTFYLFGKIRLPYDSGISRISIARLITGFIILSFVIYLIPGLWGAPLKMIKGFPPSIQYSESPMEVGTTTDETHYILGNKDIIFEKASYQQRLSQMAGITEKN